MQQSSDASLPTVVSPMNNNRYSAKPLFPTSSSSSRDGRVDSSRNTANINLRSQKSNLGVSLPFISQDSMGNNTGINSSIRWKRAEVLGQGAFGVVYLGLNLDSGELMAVKHMNYALQDMSRRELTSLENEINMLRSFRHPNIVRYIGTELSADNTLCIFLEYISGGSIKTLINKFGPLNESVVKSYSRQLLLGLEYLHRNGIAHRDIKGANCLVSNDGVIKLSDFGASKYYWKRPELIIPKSTPPVIAAGSASVETVNSPIGGADQILLTGSMDSARGRASSAALSEDDEVDFILKQTNNPHEGPSVGQQQINQQGIAGGDSEGDHNTGNDIKGTPCWIAPEVIKNESNGEAEMNWRKADIWSLACTCIEMSTGRPPWSQFDNPVTILYHLACSESIPDYPQDISMEYINFLSVCLQRDIALRADVTSLLLHPFVLVNGWGAAMIRPTTVGGTHNEDGRATADYDTASSRVSSSLWSRGGSSYSRNGGTSGGAIAPGGLGLLASRGSAGVNTASRLLFTPTKGVLPNTIEEDHNTSIPGIPQIGDMLGSTVRPTDEQRTDSPTQGHAGAAPALRVPVTVGGGYDSGDDEVLEDLDMRLAPTGGDYSPELGAERDFLEDSGVSGVESFANMQDFEQEELEASKPDQDLRSIKAGFKSGMASGTDNVVVLQQKKKQQTDVALAIQTNMVGGGDLVQVMPFCSSPVKPTGVSGRDKRKGAGRGAVGGGSNKGKLTSLSGSSGSSGGAFTKQGVVPDTGGGLGLGIGNGASIDSAMSISSWGGNGRRGGGETQGQAQPITPAGGKLGVSSAEDTKRGSAGQRHAGLAYKSTGSAHSSAEKKRSGAREAGMNGSASQGSLDALSGVAMAAVQPIRFARGPEGTSPPSMLHYQQVSPGNKKSGVDQDVSIDGEEEIEDLSDRVRAGSMRAYSAEHVEEIQDEELPSEYAQDSYRDDAGEGLGESETHPKEHQRVSVLAGHIGPVTKLRSPSKVDAALLSCGHDGTVRLWNCKTAQQALVLTQSSDGENSGSASKLTSLYANDMCSEIWSASAADGAVYMWSGLGRGSGKAIRKFSTADGRSGSSGGSVGVTCMEGLEPTGMAMQDSCLIATGSNDKTIRLWDQRAKKALVKVFKGHTDSVQCMQWLPSQRVLVSGSKDKTIRVWDIRTGKTRLVLEKHFGAVTHLCSLPNWNVGGGQVLSAGGFDMSVPAGPTCFVSGARDGMMSVWDSVNGSCLQTTAAHRGLMTSLGHIPYNIGYNNCSLLYSSGSDGIVKLWEANFRTGGSAQRNGSSTVSLSCMAELTVGCNTKVMYNHNLSSARASATMNGGLYTASTAGDSVLIWRPTAGTGSGEPAPVSRQKRDQSNGNPYQSTAIEQSGISIRPQYQFQQKPVSVGSNTNNKSDLPGVGSSGGSAGKASSNGYWRSEEVGQSLSGDGASVGGATDTQTVAVAMPTTLDPGGNASVLAVSSRTGFILLYQQIVQ